MTIQDQPPPKPNNSTAVWDLVLADIHERDRLGAERYRTRLQPFNGRHALTDLYQELLDAVAYVRQTIEEERRIAAHLPGAIDRCLDAVRWDDVDQSAIAAARAELADLRDKARALDTSLDVLSRIAEASPGGEVEHAYERAREAFKAAK